MYNQVRARTGDCRDNKESNGKDGHHIVLYFLRKTTKHNGAVTDINRHPSANIYMFIYQLRSSDDRIGFQN